MATIQSLGDFRGFTVPPCLDGDQAEGLVVLAGDILEMLQKGVKGGSLTLDEYVTRVLIAVWCVMRVVRFDNDADLLPLFLQVTNHRDELRLRVVNVNSGDPHVLAEIGGGKVVDLQSVLDFEMMESARHGARLFLIGSLGAALTTTDMSERRSLAPLPSQMRVAIEGDHQLWAELRAANSKRHRASRAVSQPAPAA